MLLIIAVQFTSGAQGGDSGFRSRYGEPYIIRYQFDQHFSVTARFDGEGHACTFRVAPLNSSSPVDQVPTAGIDLVVDRLLPHYLSRRERSSVAVNRAPEAEDFEGWHVIHERLYPFDTDRTAYVELTASRDCSSDDRRSLVSAFGPPIYEKFRVGPELSIGVTYGKDRSAKRLDIRRTSASLANEPFSVEDKLDETTAAEVLAEVLTPSVHKGLRPGINTITGGLGQSTYTLGRILVTRIFWPDASESRLAGYSIEYR